MGLCSGTSTKDVLTYLVRQTAEIEKPKRRKEKEGMSGEL